MTKGRRVSPTRGMGSPPPNAALKPRRTNAVVNVVYGGLNHHGSSGKSAWMGRLNVLHAYTEPMQM